MHPSGMSRRPLASLPSTHQVELDHVAGFALGAETTVEACRLLCRVHQDVSARRLYGDDLMDRFTRREAGRCSEPAAAYGAAGASAAAGSPSMNDASRAQRRVASARAAHGGVREEGLTR